MLFSFWVALFPSAVRTARCLTMDGVRPLPKIGHASQEGLMASSLTDTRATCKIRRGCRDYENRCVQCPSVCTNLRGVLLPASVAMRAVVRTCNVFLHVLNAAGNRKLTADLHFARQYPRIGITMSLRSKAVCHKNRVWASHSGLTRAVCDVAPCLGGVAVAARPGAIDMWMLFFGL